MKIRFTRVMKDDFRTVPTQPNPIQPTMTNSLSPLSTIIISAITSSHPLPLSYHDIIVHLNTLSARDQSTMQITFVIPDSDSDSDSSDQMNAILGYSITTESHQAIESAIEDLLDRQIIEKVILNIPFYAEDDEEQLVIDELDEVECPFYGLKQEKVQENSQQSENQDLQELKTQYESVRKQVEEFKGLVYDESSVIQDHIEKLHRYNELKDTAVMLMGRIAESEGKTTHEMYDKYGLSFDD
eukprot:TRINITY_DN32451_c0_g1_i1.p1 TRINITY_DN32451_c0_g1~~TRINITY_DN32451_c0_g1_i1.p1  ORF type:complete len:242 (+),score=67.96 TRINITY_DN32451_c0_g1_i1:247-972(+)